jgi:hypothetical protein
MAIIMSQPLTVQEMRVLQEYRRITAIKHPVGGGEAPALSLADKGFLATDASRENFTLTRKAKDFLAIDVKPEFGSPTGDDTAAE